jgi:hypothetical protein
MRKMLLLFALGLGAFAAEGAVAQGAPVPVGLTSAAVRPVGALVRPVRYGPYATLRRANEVATLFRLRGYNARVGYRGSLYPGTRRYVVTVW